MVSFLRIDPTPALLEHLPGGDAHYLPHTPFRPLTRALPAPQHAQQSHAAPVVDLYQAQELGELLDLQGQPVRPVQHAARKQPVSSAAPVCCAAPAARGEVR